MHDILWILNYKKIYKFYKNVNFELQFCTSGQRPSSNSWTLSYPNSPKVDDKDKKDHYKTNRFIASFRI